VETLKSKSVMYSNNNNPNNKDLIAPTPSTQEKQWGKGKWHILRNRIETLNSSISKRDNSSSHNSHRNLVKTNAKETKGLTKTIWNKKPIPTLVTNPKNR
jgi:hypothetical protein